MSAELGGAVSLAVSEQRIHYVDVRPGPGRETLRVSRIEGTSFRADSKKGDSRYRWFADNYGSRCWELDAMDPNDLRRRVEENIASLIEPEAWDRCVAAQQAEQESLEALLDRWRAA